MTERFLERVYGLDGPEDTRDLYDAWSGAYDEDLQAAGYASPDRVAQALKEHGAEGPVLDFGCGTGLSGAALFQAGLEPVDGIDLSSEMLARASDKGIYRRVTHVSAETPLPVAPGDYATIAAIGVIGAGAAPASMLDNLFNLLLPGNRFGFSFNDHTLRDSAFEGRVNEFVDTGAARLLFRERGPHLPSENLKSIVYVLERN